MKLKIFAATFFVLLSHSILKSVYEVEVEKLLKEIERYETEIQEKKKPTLEKASYKIWFESDMIWQLNFLREL